MASTSRSATGSQQMLMRQQFQKQNPHASQLQFLPGAEEMSDSSAPLGSVFTAPAKTNFSQWTLPKKMYGCTAMFLLDPSFSEFDLRRAEGTISGKLMQDFSEHMGDGPSFQCVEGKSDVMHADCLPNRRACDTVNWKPYFGNGSIKIVQAEKTPETCYLVVDVPELKNAAQAFENTFPSSRKKVPLLKVAQHHLNDTLEITAIRNACKIAAKFGELAKIKFNNTKRDIFATQFDSSLPVPCALSLDRPFLLDNPGTPRNVTVSSGLRKMSVFCPVPLAVSPGKVCTYVVDGISSPNVRLPAYFSTIKSRNTNFNSATIQKFHQEKVCYPNKTATVNTAVIQRLLPEVESQKYHDYVSSVTDLPVQSFDAVAVFTL